MTSHDELTHKPPSLEELHKHRLKMLVTIVNRADGKKTTKFFRDRRFHFQFDCMAKGTQGIEIMNLLGLDSIDKTVIFCVSPGRRIDSALMEVSKELNLKKAGKGIAFTIPLTGISLPTASSVSHQHTDRWQQKIEDKVDTMNHDITHSIILALVNRGNSEELIEVARAAGATGGTVINARRTGVEDVVKFFGISVQMEKEIVAILTTREAKHEIMDAVNDSFGIKSPAHGIIFSIPVDGVAGVRM